MFRNFFQSSYFGQFSPHPSSSFFKQQNCHVLLSNTMILFNKNLKLKPSSFFLSTPCHFHHFRLALIFHRNYDGCSHFVIFIGSSNDDCSSKRGHEREREMMNIGFFCKDFPLIYTLTLLNTR